MKKLEILWMLALVISFSCVFAEKQLDNYPSEVGSVKEEKEVDIEKVVVEILETLEFVKEKQEKGELDSNLIDTLKKDIESNQEQISNYIYRDSWNDYHEREIFIRRVFLSIIVEKYSNVSDIKEALIEYTTIHSSFFYTLPNSYYLRYILEDLFNFFEYYFEYDCYRVKKFMVFNHANANGDLERFEACLINNEEVMSKFGDELQNIQGKIKALLRHLDVLSRLKINCLSSYKDDFDSRVQERKEKEFIKYMLESLFNGKISQEFLNKIYKNGIKCSFGKVEPSEEEEDHKKIFLNVLFAIVDECDKKITKKIRENIDEYIEICDQFFGEEFEVINRFKMLLKICNEFTDSCEGAEWEVVDIDEIEVF